MRINAALGRILMEFCVPLHFVDLSPSILTKLLANMHRSKR